MQVVIIGGGITGLAAAFEMATRGLPCRLLEASSRLGGLIRTDRVAGFTIEAGPDSILAQKPAALRLCEQVGLADQLIPTLPPRTAFVLKGRHLHPLPSPSVLGIPATWSGLAGYSLLSWPARARLAAERFVPAARSEDESVGSFFRRRFGRATVDLIAEPLLAGIHAGDIECLSVRSLFPRLVEAERRGGVLRSLRSQARPEPDGVFRSLAGGMDTLVAALAARLDSTALHVSTPVRRLLRRGGEWEIQTPSGSHAAMAVVLAIPAHAAAALLHSSSEEAARLSAQVPYVSTASVALAWPRAAIDHPLAGSGFVVARRYSRRRITACTWVSSKWPGRAPEGMALLRVFLGGAHDPGAVDLSDEALRDVAAADVADVLRIQGPPVVWKAYRWRHAGAQHNVGQLARTAAVEAALAREAPGLFVAGSGYRSVGIPDCVEDGRAAAAAAARYAEAKRE